MNLHQKVLIYIEIEKNSNIKYEFCKKENKLIIDRILSEQYKYPYAYGYIPNTLGDDGDELDALIITNKDNIFNNKYYDAYIIGHLKMHDEKGKDEKIICILEEDYNHINDINDLDNEIKIEIELFFNNYKNNEINKWSKTFGYESKEKSIELFKKSIIVK